QRVQPRRCLWEPSTSARTRWRFGSVRFLVLLLAWLTWLPTRGPLPQRSHLNAIEDSPELKGPRTLLRKIAKSSQLGCHDGFAAREEQRLGRGRAGCKYLTFQA